MTPDMTRIAGPNLVLRLITPDDAAYVHGLRIDPAYNTHLSEVRGTVADQRAWIEAYKAREAAGQEFYYIITRSDGTRCGTVRLYDITSKSFTWGSWILDHNKPPKAALESAILVYDIAFCHLNCKKATFEVRKENYRTISFHERFGAIQTSSDQENVYFILTQTDFKSRRDKFYSIVKLDKDDD